VSFACSVIVSDETAEINQRITKRDDQTGTHIYTCFF